MWIFSNISNTKITGHRLHLNTARSFIPSATGFAPMPAHRTGGKTQGAAKLRHRSCCACLPTPTGRRCQYWKGRGQQGRCGRPQLLRREGKGKPPTKHRRTAASLQAEAGNFSNISNISNILFPTSRKRRSRQRLKRGGKPAKNQAGNGIDFLLLLHPLRTAKTGAAKSKIICDIWVTICDIWVTICDIWVTCPL